MQRLKRVLLFVLLLPLAAAPVSAAIGGVSPAGGAGSSASYAGIAVLGSPAAGPAASSTYSSVSGTGLIFASTGANPPLISGLKIDGIPVINGDYVDRHGTLTAYVSSDAYLDTALSSVEVDGVATAFAALTGESSYNAASALLVCKLDLSAAGSHLIRVLAADSDGNATAVSLTVKVAGGALAATAVYVYPNPYNPAAGSARFAYQLNQNAATTIYLFNAVGELIYKREQASGMTGGQAGYNEVFWDGQSDFGDTVGSDLYFLRVVSDGKSIGKAKFAVLN